MWLSAPERSRCVTPGALAAAAPMPEEVAGRPRVVRAGDPHGVTSFLQAAVLKIEFYTRRHWPTETEAKQAVATWMEGRYNRLRPHSGVAMISPLRFEEAPHLSVQAAERVILTCAP